MNRWLRAVAGIGLAAGLISIVSALAALRTERGARAAIALVGDVAGYDIGMREVHVSGWRWTVDDLRVAAAGEAEFLRARRFTVELTPGSLLHKSTQSVVLDDFELDYAHLPARKGGATRQPFDELRAFHGVVRHVSATIEEIRIPEIVFARDEQRRDFDIHGRLESGAGLDVVWTGRAAANGDDLAVHVEGTLRNAVSPLRIAAIASAEPSSTVSFNGDVSGSLHGDLHATAAAEVSIPALRVPVRALVRLDRSAATGEIAYKADLVAEGLTVPLQLSGVVRRQSATENVELKASWRDLELSEVSASLRDPAWFDASAGRLNLDASAEGTLRAPAFRVAIDVKHLSATVSAVDVTGNGSLSFIYADGALTSSGSGLTLDSVEISRPGLKATVTHLRAEPALDVGSSTMSFRLERLATEGLAFSDSGHELQASGIAATGRMELSLSGVQDRGATLALSAPRGEVLYKRAYLDITAAPAVVNLHLSSKDTTWTGDGSVELTDLGTLHADGELDRSSDRKRLHVTTEIPQLRAPFEKLVRDTFADVHPALVGTSIAGAASLDVVLGSTASGRAVSGRLRLHDVAFDIKSPSFHGNGIALDLPIALSTRDNETGKVSHGKLHIAEAMFGGTTIGPIDVPLTVHTNEIAAAAPLRILVAGGEILVEGLRAHALASAAPALDTRVAIDNLDLADLTEAAGLLRIDGRVNGSLGLVQFANGRVATDAAIDVSAFGGNIHVSDVSMDSVFSRVPALRVDAVLSHIDLGKATEAIGVGHVSGIAEGAVNDLEIAAGAPVRFDAHFESVPVSGVSQRISVTAIDQLTVFGGGPSGSLAQSMMGFFKEYRYAKLGFRCTLTNDRFILHGVAAHNGKDFLVVGTMFPPSVNVVSHNPAIAFREMVERLQRVTKSGTEPQQQGAGDQQ